MKVSYSQLTDMTGRSYRTLKKMMDGLEPVGTSRNNANLWESKEALPLIYGYGVKADEQLNGPEEKARLDRARRVYQEIKNQELEGQLISLDQVNEESTRNRLMIRNRFLAMPARLAQMLETAGTFNERFQMIDQEIKNALIALADGVEA